jgi:hypothetical protein
MLFASKILYTLADRIINKTELNKKVNEIIELKESTMLDYN